jgi:putative thioredoxin
LASLATAATERTAMETFRRDVIEASMTGLVLVDFWATWCGPCKTFTPIIESVVATYPGRVSLVKIDIDKNQTVAAQLQVQSVPTVYAFLNGQPVDAFAGAVGERELKAFIDRLLAVAPSGTEGATEDIGPLVEAGLAALDEGALAEAVEMFRALSAEAPERADVAAGLARALTLGGDPESALAALDALPEAARKDALAVQARASATLALSAADAGDLATARCAVEAAPDDLNAAFAYANAAIAAGERDEAADALLGMIARDRAWNAEAAKARLLQLFEAEGLADPWVVAQRRKLSAIMFA